MKLICGITTTITGLIVLVGWVTQYTPILNLQEGWVTMKTLTAICFVLSGLIIISLSKQLKDKYWAQVVLSASTIGLLFFLGGTATLHIFEAALGMENLFAKEAVDLAIKSARPGEPSIATTLCFAFIAAIGLTKLFHINDKKVTKKMGGAIFSMGVFALLGYLLGQPLMYYYVPQISSGMAAHTALIFTGIGLTTLVS